MHPPILRHHARGCVTLPVAAVAACQQRFTEQLSAFRAFDSGDGISGVNTRVIGSAISGSSTANPVLHVLTTSPPALHSVSGWYPTHAPAVAASTGPDGDSAPRRVSYDLQRALHPVSMGGIPGRPKTGAGQGQYAVTSIGGEGDVAVMMPDAGCIALFSQFSRRPQVFPMPGKCA